LKRLSIGLRLTLWYLAIFLLAEFVFGGGMWLILRKNLYDIADASLEDQAGDLQRFLVARQAEDQNRLREEISADFKIERSEDYLQIADPDGNWIYRSEYLERNPLPPISAGQLEKPRYRNRWLGKLHFRVMSQKMEAGGRVFVVQIGSNLDEEDETLDAFRKYLLMFAPILLLAASAVGYWLSRKALAPVDALARTARTISGQNLGSRLEQLHTGDELQRLSDTLNEMLDRIETAFQRITQFTADASHELRTPVALIRTEAELALRRSRDAEEYREALRHILLEADRTSTLIEELLSLARADAGRETLNRQAMDLSISLRDSSASWRQVAALRNLHFEEHIDVQQLPVMGDETALRRVLNILLDNAFKYTPAPGRVVLRAEEKDGRAIVSVEDSGIGIARGDQAKIFERFYRVDKARSRELGGTGLGLAIAQWIIQLHQGTIAVESTPGSGSVFRIELPTSTHEVSRIPVSG
jgi:heavy metal sensor kinase